MNDIFRNFMNIRVKRLGGSFLLNKPLLLLFTLGRCHQKMDRLALFHLYEDALLSISCHFGKINAVFPFGRLLIDGVWDIPNNRELYRNNSGDFLRSELIEKNVLGGFTVEVYSKLSIDLELMKSVTIMLLKKYIPKEKWSVVISTFNITFSNIDSLIQENGIDQYHAPDIMINHAGETKLEDDLVAEKTNSFISYLNSLHNLQANGANALAESQALSPYFGEIYEPFPLIDKLINVLTNNGEEVAIILTGHAGDGKSTVALDVLKKLRNLPLSDPLSEPLDEREDIDTPSGRITIVKDMSELSAERRQQWLHQAFSEQGSWLIISNTGPLLHSIVDYAKIAGNDQKIESKILEYLDRPLSNDLQNRHSLDDFAKKLIVLNLTRLDNVPLGAKILTKLVTHSAWAQCEGCSIEPACPLVLNRKALLDAGPVVEERVRWVYQRLNAYEKRLTLRQIVAQLAFGLTGGMNCKEAQQQVATSLLEGSDRGSVGLERILFSESFFGYRGGKPWPQAEGLHAVALLRRATFGAPVAVEFERRLPVEAGIGWAVLPSALNWVGARWRQRATESAGVNWRFALRRMNYLFGKVVSEPGKEDSATVFIDAFLQSPSLRDLDQWQTAGKLTLSLKDISRLRTSCLRVLLEIFSGFSAGQFRSNDSLYMTLRRPDRTVIQPTQLVIKSLSFDSFDLYFDPIRHTPVLDFGNGQVQLVLTLPLLDYIRRRDAGELGNELSPIHQAQLDWFRAKLLWGITTTGVRCDQDQIELLHVGIDGEIHFHRFFLDRDSNKLEKL